MITDELSIVSPKRGRRLQSGWEGFFPYYAGYPELFARELLQSADLAPGAVVLDPWNGSGTTTYTAASLGFNSIGIDLNPVMIIVARARLLPTSEADHLRPLAATILAHAHSLAPALDANDALLSWLDPLTAAFVRAIERNIRRTLVGSMTKSPDGVHLDRISGTAATLYVALFAACRRLVAPFRSSNPTWLRAPKSDDDRIFATQAAIAREFGKNVRGMAAALIEKHEAGLRLDEVQNIGECKVCLSDTAAMDIKPASIDFVLTSPPYCTRIDYTAATRIELAVLSPLLKTEQRALGRQMIGSTQVPTTHIEVDDGWGATCLELLGKIKAHPSRASASYYYRTHLDYFDKMDRSMARLAAGLKPGARAVLVVQDSYYKEMHNDLPAIITELGSRHGLTLSQSKAFHMRSMSDVHPGRRTYARPCGATETVLCFRA
jgi:hypothetical protein